MSGRLAALPPEALSLLEAASVVGRDFDLPVAASAAGIDLPAALDAYDEAARHGLVEPGTGAGHRFVHALFQEAVLASVPPGRSVRLHAAVGRRLEDTGAPADLVAEHLWLARDLVGAAAVPHLVGAADNAAGVLAYEQAEHHLRRAAELLAQASPPDHQQELTVLLKLFTLVAGVRGWGTADAAALAQRARRLASTVGLRDDAVRLWWSLWLYFLGKGDAPTTGELAQTLMDQVADEGDSCAAVAAHLMCMFRHLAEQGGEQSALLHLDVAARLIEEVAVGELAAYDLNLAAVVLSTQAHVAAMRGRHDDQRTAARRAVAVAETDGRPVTRAMARTLAAQSAALAGVSPKEVRLLVDDAREIDDRYGYTYLSSQASILDTWVRAHLDGSPAELAAELERKVDDVVDAGLGGSTAVVLCMLGDVRVRAGDMEGARAAYGRARADPGPYRQLMVDLLDRRLDS
jgi:hypothetical protein